jgi:nucleoside-diphosphate-sugar epimerase
METLGLFKVAQVSPWLPVLDPRARLALVHVEDAARQILDLTLAWRPGTFALSDSRYDGYSWRELMTAAAAAVGKKPRLQRIPDGLITAAAHLSGGLSFAIRKNSIFTSGKAREMLHLDWSLSPTEIVPGAIAPRYGIDSGFTQSVCWYRANRFLVAST